ncbi:hypothetical protein C351_05458 [Cryptococcus neoformans c8]|nr:hypothetical protein C353_05611 [Cryptococcus neoformans var. grubii AD1-83a]OXG51256.1 hypothetical protein C354_05552 [Cryptococcus neoformans var. grubii MW-RSA1955]OXG55393.1 hypothetical protein C352_05534 [Cryptococcus neoformans var. grubii CHC193]OXG59173.1 hypothetical protein C351_05458 [Cryptococcus neoformans var. grubii c8]OXH04298.1 hypothetical protein C369_05738 [Cryptococcus neoformans var. grubii A5-35-17]OXH05676.1 hypothetical protein C370_05824 [Cryptococcus neoformans 
MKMARIPEYLQAYLEKFPLQAGPLLTSIKDLSLSVGWCDLRIVPLSGDASDWIVMVGHKRKEDPLRAVLPLPLHTTSLRPSVLKAIFKELALIEVASLPEPISPFAPTLDELREQLGQRQTSEDAEKLQEEKEGGSERADQGKPGGKSEEFDRETIYMAIVTGDSAVVYYKLSKGIKKPADIPDE